MYTVIVTVETKRPKTGKFLQVQCSVSLINPINAANSVKPGRSCKCEGIYKEITVVVLWNDFG
jgi:hypothetical protein